MKLDFKLEVKGDTVSMACPQANWHMTVPNSVLYDITENKIMATGETPATMMQEEPEWWEENQAFVGFCDPFSEFGIENEFGWMFILNYTEQVRKKMRPLVWRYFLFHGIDKLQLELIIPDFLKLNENIREEFEFQLITTRDFRRFRINNASPKWRYWQFLFSKYLRTSLLLIFLVFFFGLYMTFLPNEITARTVSDLNDFILLLVIGLIPLFTLLALAILGALKIWSMLIRLLFPRNLAQLLIKQYIGNKKSQKTNNRKTSL